ncbi:MAG TPA: LCP family protein, partial [Pseudonocardiaceae bacterium]|nr:LCP family protein [Pseudonocardiaceae bacterium]
RSGHQRAGQQRPDGQRRPQRPQARPQATRVSPPADANAFAPTERTEPVADAAPARRPGANRAERPPARDPLADRRRRIGVNAGRTALALLSVVALAATGYAWSTLRNANNGLVTADVLDKGSTSDKPPDGSMDILLVGMDSRTDAKGNPLPADQLAQLHAGPDDGELDTDTMILIHIPNGGGQATGISIPRDSWVNIPGYGEGKINSAYGLAKNTAMRKLRGQGVSGPSLDVQSNEAGARETITTIEQLTGVGIDHYAAVNLMGFYQISNAVGGVPVCLLHAVKDSKSGADFPAGRFSVKGVQALEFVRQRHNIPGGSTDLEREQRQQAFLASMAHQILSAGTLTNPSKLNSLISAIESAVTVDNHWNLLDFAQEMSGMSSGAIKFQTVPVVNIDYRPKGPHGISAVEVSPAQINAFVHGVTGVPADTSGSQAAGSGATGNAAITVDVKNASGVTGLAGNVLDQLGAKGFTKGDTSSVTHRTSSVIFYPPGHESDGQTVADALTGKFLLEEGPSVPSGHVWVYLGRNFKASDAADTIVGPRHGVVAADIAAPVVRAATPAAPPTTSTTPAGGTPQISDAGSAPCIN